MNKDSKLYDVYLSYTIEDRPHALRIVGVLANAGLAVCDPWEAAPGGDDASEVLRRAIAVSDACVAILGPWRGEAPSQMMVEVGAARAWGKQIFFVKTGPDSVRLPVILPDSSTFPMSGLDGLVRAIRHAQVGLDERQRRALQAAYLEMNRSTDRIIADASLLEELGDRFQQHSGMKVPAERLFRELIRQRKHGELPRLRHNGPRLRATSNSG